MLFISTALAVFERNAEEFYPDLRLFAPNATVFAVCAGAWLFLSIAWPRPDSLVRLSLGLTVAVLMCTMAAGRTHGHSQQQLYWFFAAALSAPLIAVASRSLSARTLRQFLLASLVLTAAWDGWDYHSLGARTPQLAASTMGPTPSPSAESLPNIYHFVFDAFQADVFGDLSGKDADGILGGFIWFRNTTPSSADTVNALAEIFSSHDADRFLWTEPDWPGRRDEFYRDAHAGTDSLKSRLKQLGYWTVGHVFYPTQYPHFAKGFDDFVPHYAYVEGHPAQLDDSRLFFNLWLVSILPTEISNHLVPNMANQRLTARATLSRFSSLVSYGAVEKFIGEEYSQPAHGRYVFFHILLPHKPFIFTESCETSDKDWGDTPDDGAVRGQYGCAPSVIGDITGTLKRLGRFDDSMIIVQGDHGDGFRKDSAGRYYRVIDRNVPDTFTRSVLLVKAPGSTAATPLRTSQFPARVGDVTPTILARVDPASGGTMKGVDLLRKGDKMEPRTRYFYWETETGTLRYQSKTMVV